MDSTTLELLTKDGILNVSIVPSLDSEHYDELHDVVCESQTTKELRDKLKAACDRWRHTVHFD